MSKETVVIALGIWIIIVPYLGVPSSWKSILLVLSGLVVVSLGFFLRTEALSRTSKITRSQPFVENSSSAAHELSHDRKEGITSLN